MNGVGLSTVGRLLGHRQRETTAIYAHLDDGALRDAAAQAAAVIARAMGYRTEAPPSPDEADHSDELAAMPKSSIPNAPALPERSELRCGSNPWSPNRGMARSRMATSGRLPAARTWNGCDRTSVL